MLQYKSWNLVINRVQMWIVGEGPNSGAIKLRLFAEAVGLCCMHNTMLHSFLEK